MHLRDKLCNAANQSELAQLSSTIAETDPPVSAQILIKNIRAEGEYFFHCNSILVRVNHIITWFTDAILEDQDFYFKKGMIDIYDIL